MRLVRSALGVLVFVGAAWVAPSVAAPQQLFNKTVILTWTANATLRDPDGRERQSSSNIRYVIYISSLGRLFEHASRTSGGRTQGGDTGLNAAQTRMGEARGLAFKGNALVVNRGYAGGRGSGAMQAVATFDGSYSSCTLEVTHGREGGVTMKRQGIDGVVREILSISVSGPSCFIQNGNAFANS